MLAAAVPGLMKLTRYDGWANVGERHHWEQLAERLGPADEKGPETLEEAFDFMARALGMEDEPDGEVDANQALA